MKKLISAILCLSIVYSLCVPAMAVSAAKKEPELPPGVVLMEGEVWIPAEEDAMRRGDEDEVVPPGYTYEGKIKGNFTCEIVWGGVGETFLSVAIPALIIATVGAPITIPAFVGFLSAGSNVLAYYTTPKEEQGDYERMIYSCDDPGIYPYINFHHIVYYATVRNGNGTTYRMATAEKTEYEYALLPK